MATSDIEMESPQSEETHIKETEETLLEALKSLEGNVQSCIPTNLRAEKKIEDLPKYEFIQFICIKSYFSKRLQGIGIMDASTQVAKVIFNTSVDQSYRAKAIRNWANYYIRHKKLCEFRRGKHSKTFTIITDETIKEELRKHIRSLKYVERYPENVMRKLNNEWLSLIPRAPSKISETTAKRWMQYLNFRPEKSGKGYFVDGHERDDVVAHRKLFLEDFKNIEKRMFSWRGANMTEHDDLPAGVKRSVFITQDESLFYTNDAIKLTWEEKGGTQDGANKKIRPKSMGRDIHVSGFVCDCHGFMTSPSTGRKSYEIMKLGKNADGYWTNDDLCKQLEADAIPIAEELHPNCDLIWGFDNSQNHHARKPDALWAPNLPLKDNGKNAPKMRSTTWNGHVQSMQNAAGHQY